MKEKRHVVQTLASESGLRSIVKVVELADFASLGDPTPLSTKSPLWLSCFWKTENVPTDFDSTIPEAEYTLEGSGTMTCNSYSSIRWTTFRWSMKFQKKIKDNASIANKQRQHVDLAYYVFIKLPNGDMLLNIKSTFRNYVWYANNSYSNIQAPNM